MEAKELVPIEPEKEYQAISVFDIPEIAFANALNRRGSNRSALMEWVRRALVENVDFGRLHTMGKDRCAHTRNGGTPATCPNQQHFSKPSLFKPGAEKICGMLGMTATFPTLADYEQRVIRGEPVEQIILRCVLVSGSGTPIAEGVGARSVSKDYGDLNKSLKMAEKSAQIDATLRAAGLSEVFTQDLEDMLAREERAIKSFVATIPKDDLSPVLEASIEKVRKDKGGSESVPEASAAPSVSGTPAEEEPPAIFEVQMEPEEARRLIEEHVATMALQAPNGEAGSDADTQRWLTEKGLGQKCVKCEGVMEKFTSRDGRVYLQCSKAHALREDALAAGCDEKTAKGFTKGHSYAYL